LFMIRKKSGGKKASSIMPGYPVGMFGALSCLFNNW
jgi:hypothetical protein